MMSLNLLNVNLHAANSRMNGLYFCSVNDVHLDANAIRCILSTVFPLGNVVLKCCVSTAPKPSLHPSVVMTNGVPSHFGPLSTGSDVSAFLSARNALVCVVVH